MKRQSDAPFFVGYLPVPGGLGGFLAIASLAILLLFAGSSWLIGATQDDPGNGAFRFDYGRQTVTGVLELEPYPLLYVAEGSKRVKPGQTLMLSAGGKNGLTGRAEPFVGKMVKASGVILDRGDLEMLQLRGGKAGLDAIDDAAPEPVPAPVALGRWKLAGEICDGKCVAGAMRPGTGLAHKACANLCLIGKVPPIFVSSQKVEGSEYLLIAGPDGGPLPEITYDYVGLFVTIEAELERRGDLLVMKIDPDSIEVL